MLCAKFGRNWHTGGFSEDVEYVKSLRTDRQTDLLKKEKCLIYQNSVNLIYLKKLLSQYCNMDVRYGIFINH